MTDHNNIDVSIIVVSYNTREMTLEALQSVKRETQSTRYELLVVDNNSHDGSAEAIRENYPEAHVIALSKNIGFAAANNLAAIKASGRYLLLLNPDTIVKDRAIDKLVNFATDTPEAKIWGGRTHFGDGTLNPSSCWNRMTLWNCLCRATGLTGLFANSEIFNSETFGAWQRNTMRQVDIVSGCFFLIKRDFWNTLSGFDPTFFMYGEEADLCLRAKALGAAPMITPDATIIHYGGASETAQEHKLIKLLAAKATLIKRHFRPQQIALGLALLKTWPRSRKLAFWLMAKATGKTTWANNAAIWQAVWDQRERWQDGWPDQLPNASSENEKSVSKSINNQTIQVAS